MPWTVSVEPDKPEANVVSLRQRQAGPSPLATSQSLRYLSIPYRVIAVLDISLDVIWDCFAVLTNRI
jgi:hypothetical protein